MMAANLLFIPTAWSRWLPPGVGGRVELLLEDGSIVESFTPIGDVDRRSGKAVTHWRSRKPCHPNCSYGYSVHDPFEHRIVRRR